MNEFETKKARIHELLDRHGLDALLLNRVSSFAWATCGGDPHINTADSRGVGSLWITRDARYLVTTNIEAPRFEREENLAAQGWKFHVTPWYKGSGIAELAGGEKYGADGPFAGAEDLSWEIA